MRRYTLLSQLVLVCAMVMPMPVFAEESTQSITRYYCDFEDENEVQQWNLLVGPQATSIPNKWVVGSALNNGGQNALYVSSDGGKSVSYTGSQCTILATRTLTLAKTGETYTLSFDWLTQGYVNDVDGLYVAWVPNRDYSGDSIVLHSVNYSTFPNSLSEYLFQVNPQDIRNPTQLYRTAIWQNCQTTIPAWRTGEPYRLVFIWCNGTIGFDTNTSACIDNIIISNSSTSCTAPTDLKTTVLNNDSVQLDWNGNADQYEVGCHGYQQQTWQIDTVHTNTYTFSHVPEGLCDFYVRAICRDEQRQTYYSGKAMDYRLIYHEDNHCINYITTLSDSNCYINTETPTYVTGDYKYTNKLVDYGFESEQSRHTFHYLKTETDPRTGSKLKTIPDDEVVSMRLGNWSAGGESERVEFSFEVDSTMSVFSLKYAVVLEAPGHDREHGYGPNSPYLRDPRFMFKVLGVNDTDAHAASADFNATWSTVGWNIAGGPTLVMWKDWTTVSINLAQYVGKTLTVQLTTFDCTYYGHYGYAYFTLGCTYNKVGIQSIDGETVDFVAPEGFTYKWYLQDNTTGSSRKQAHCVKNNDDTTILSREQTYRVKNNDDRTYIVELTSLLDTTRTYTLSACLIERYPVAEATYSIRQENEKNYIQFNNTSHVRSLNVATSEVVEYSQYALDSVTWHFGDLAAATNQWHPEVEVPAEGGTYRIALTATIGQRDSTIYMDVEVPAITAALEDIESTDGNFITTRIVQCGELFTMSVSEPVTYQWLSLTGQCLSEGILEPHASLRAPITRGWFFLKIRTSTRTLMERVLVQ